MKALIDQETQDFEIFELKISGKNEDIDISRIYDKIVIREDLFSNHIIGEIYVTDVESLIEKIPIVGEEKVTIEFGYPRPSDRKGLKKWKIEGVIYRLSDRQRKGKGSVKESYVLHFCDSVAIKNKLKRISKTYKDGKIDEYVQTIAKEDLEVDIKDVEETKKKIKVSIPNLSPLASINFLSKFAHKGDGEETMFLFYQDKEEFKFKNIEKLIQEKNNNEIEIYIDKLNNWFDINHPIQVYLMQIENQVQDINADISKIIKQSLGGESFNNLSENQQKNIKNKIGGTKTITIQDFLDTALIEIFDIYQAEDYKFVESFNNFECAEIGYYGFTNYSHDTLTKSFHKVEFNYGKFHKPEKSLNKNQNKSDFEVFKSPLQTKIYVKSTNAGKVRNVKDKGYLSEKGFEIEEHFDEKRKPLRNTNLSKIHKGASFILQLPGNLKFRLGDVIKLKFPSHKVQDESSRARKYEDDKYYSGNYIILEMTHTIMKLNTWNTEIKVVSDTLSKGL